MANEEKLERVFARTDGRCHICGGGLCFSNYGRQGARGAWEIEHSVPRCKGGSDRLNNLYPAHIRCNRQKGSCGTKTARSWYDRSRAPLSAHKKAQVRKWNAVGGGVLGLLIGAVSGGLGAALLGTGTGAWLGHGVDPDPS